MTLEKTKGQVAARGSGAGSAFKKPPHPTTTNSPNRPECEQATRPVDNPSKSSGRRKKRESKVLSGGAPRREGVDKWSKRMKEQEKEEEKDTGALRWQNQ